MIARLTAAGHRVAPVDWTSRTAFLDDHVDLPPYRSEPHLRPSIMGHTCTSIGLILRRG